VPAALAPRMWLGHLVVLALVVAAALLGRWQLDAWQTRRADEARDLTHADPVALADVMGPDDPFPGRSVGQPVDVEGQWVGAGTVFVSGREHLGHDGYWMVTPLAVGGTGRPAVPVVLGWVADPTTAPAAPQGTAELTGWLQPAEGTGEVDDDPGDDVLPQLRIADLLQHVDQDLYGAYVVAEHGVDGLPAADLAQLPDAGRFTAVRNLLYAIEWWFFGGFAVLIWWRWVREQLALDDNIPQPEGEDRPDTVKA
jgi:surfeit locus 1 family protein